MKKTILFRIAAALPVVLLVFSSCSKEGLTKSQQKQSANNQSALNNGNGGRDTDDPGTASIDAIIMPEKAMATVRLFSPEFISAEVTPDANGAVRFTELAEGTYTLVITPRGPGFVGKKIPEIFVPDGQAVDLGTITIDWQPAGDQ